MKIIRVETVGFEKGNRVLVADVLTDHDDMGQYKGLFGTITSNMLSLQGHVEVLLELEDGINIYEDFIPEELKKVSKKAEQALKNLDRGATAITPPIMGELFDLGFFTPEDCKQGNHKEIDYNDDGVLICLWCGQEFPNEEDHES